MARKLFLPLTQRVTDRAQPPSAAEIRERLGGRVADPPSWPLGEAVCPVKDPTRVGLVLAAVGEQIDVYFERGLVKRTQRSELAPALRDPPQHLLRAREHVLVFAALTEGQSVLVEQGSDRGRAGVLVEKCRYGALVELADGKLLGAGFQVLWPAPDKASDQS